MDFYDALPHHIDAINEAIAGLPRERIRVHYCYGNYLGSHKFDADFYRVLPELLRLKAGTLVGEAANPRHEGDSIIIRKHLKEHSWPSHLKYAVGVIDVKTPFLETPETVAARLHSFASIDGIGPDRILGGTDCGFQTFANFHNVPYAIGLQKLEALARGAEFASSYY
jgi:5-methyltetrahydropteroyltriglutamate--homocysteine methyltransferase